MKMRRIVNHPILGQRRDMQQAAFTFDDEQFQGYVGEPIAAALLANGRRVLRKHEESGTPRGIYCAIGHCMECRVNVQGKGIVRACITPLEPGMTVYSCRQLPNEITGRMTCDAE